MKNDKLILIGAAFVSLDDVKEAIRLRMTEEVMCPSRWLVGKGISAMVADLADEFPGLVDAVARLVNREWN